MQNRDKKIEEKKRGKRTCSRLSSTQTSVDKVKQLLDPSNRTSYASTATTESESKTPRLNHRSIPLRLGLKQVDRTTASQSDYDEWEAPLEDLIHLKKTR